MLRAALLSCMCLVATGALGSAQESSAPAAAASAAPMAMPAAPKMPPGMTPAIMQMMMKPGPLQPAGIPKGMVPVAGCIPSMGYHYVKPSDWPMGPIYGWYGGKPVFTEVMPSKAQFEKGFDLNNIKALPGYTIDHIDIWYEPNGHPGMPAPHYDIHAWYIPHDKHMTFCGNKSGLRPAFV
jgi:hypothetical protein